MSSSNSNNIKKTFNPNIVGDGVLAREAPSSSSSSLGEMKIHSYDGRKLMRRSDGLFHDHFEVDGFVLKQPDMVRGVLLVRKHFINEFVPSFEVLSIALSRTKIPFICEDGLAVEWNSENLIELLKGKSDEFVLNHKGDKNNSGVISLKSDLTIKV
ncbi:hypothetical protein Tco_1391520 [Tanacetum coccineum]